MTSGCHPSAAYVKHGRPLASGGVRHCPGIRLRNPLVPTSEAGDSCQVAGLHDQSCSSPEASVLHIDWCELYCTVFIATVQHPALPHLECTAARTDGILHKFPTRTAKLSQLCYAGKAGWKFAREATSFFSFLYHVAMLHYHCQVN